MTTPGIPPTEHGPNGAGGLPLTGERTGPDEPDENYWFQRHVVAYRAVAERVRGTVLDAGCGEGYGLEILLAAGVRGVIGAELDPVTADHARRRYGDDSVDEIDVIEADLTELPLVDDTLDAAVCLQVVEHLDDAATALAELVRVVHPGGRVAVSTPNRLTFSVNGQPVNPSHVRDYTSDELTELCERAGLNIDEVSGVHHRAEFAERLAALVGDDPVTTLARPDGWNDSLRALVRAVTPDDFVLTPDGPDHPIATSLDLLVWGHVPG